ncbi:outer membrane protein assembly factor BamE [Phreatobacter cathodiphilus]|jgi:outer membrane protein assembly factor BamE (lipoprotein component of BamABCDE complex)|uniref:Outer membrane protein assembly factor BamE n=1 Tax=Phreatobacter cathodiphilus TaxID=1868589 RepID=A0A2S0N9A1_9HYPH|nr:outer membrane protein assembly factor BamE [Phreatobacter cathodiphilus]
MMRVTSRSAQAALVAGLAVLLSACSQGPSVSSLTPSLPTPTQFRIGETFNRGYVVSEEALAQVKEGNSQDQVMIALGTPTTISTINGDVFYYISEKQTRTFTFQQPRTVERNVMAVYFNSRRQVERVANYGLQDGKVFDFISRSTVTGGEEANLLRQIIQGPRT